MRAIAELKAAVNDLGMRGAAVDPYLAQNYANDAKYYPVYAKCCELDIPIVFTTGPATLVPGAIIDHVAPRYIDFVARDFPELKIVISHGGYPWVNEAIIVAERNKNVYIDLSEYEFSPMAEAYVQAANSMIADKMLIRQRPYPSWISSWRWRTTPSCPSSPRCGRRSCMTTPPASWASRVPAPRWRPAPGRCGSWWARWCARCWLVWANTPAQAGSRLARGAFFRSFLVRKSTYQERLLFVGGRPGNSRRRAREGG